MASIKVKLRPSIVPGKAGTVYYQISHRQITRQITTNIHLHPTEWQPLSGRIAPWVAGASRLQSRIDGDCRYLRRIIERLDRLAADYTTADILRQFRVAAGDPSILAFMREQIAFLQSSNRLGTARNYERALCSFAKFLGDDIPIAAMTEQLIDEYNLFLMQRGIVRNTISFYMRILRSVYNKAVRRNLTEQATPFRNVYTGIDRTRTRAIDKQIIARLKRLDLSRSHSLALARDLFMFSFYTRGMAFVDMAYLKRSDMQDDTIRYVRRKTGQLLSVHIEPSIRAIIDRYAGQERTYLFPILTDDDPARTFVRYQNALTYYNRRLKKLAAMLGLEAPLSSYWARHSWATAARNLQVPLSVISAGMGHTSERTTRIYLAMLENSEIDAANTGIIEAIDRALLA